MNEAEKYIFKLECNIDDCTGEVLGYVMDRLFDAGARDVHYIPVYMKKNRPGWQLNVICDEAHLGVLEEIIFMETTTIGIRRIRLERTVMERQKAISETPYGPVEMKICTYGTLKKAYPEYESVAAIARSRGLSYSEVFAAAVKSYTFV